nr:glycine cleavage system aminomethyltransferase GcvT [Saprospiraceae bacterium]
MNKTPLHQKHLNLGAKMSPYAGYEMPVIYTGITEEHQAVRTHAGIFDVSHMGEFIVKGKEALNLVQHVTSNDASKLTPGKVQYSCFPNREGGIVDDLLVYRLFDDQCAEGETAFMLVVNGANVDKDLQWVKSNNSFDTEVIDISDRTGLIALQGPKAEKILGEITDLDLSAIPFYNFKKGRVSSFDNVLVSATGYTGSGGFEIYAKNDHIGKIWDELFTRGKSLGLKPAGLGARDTLRLEMGYCLYGNDINDKTSPLEAGLGWITKLKKGSFIGSEAIAALKEKGIQKKLVGFRVVDRRVPRNGYPIYDEKDKVIGEVTSGTQSPSLGCPIGMGYVAVEYAVPGTPIRVKAGKKMLQARVEKLPLFKNS